MPDREEIPDMPGIDVIHEGTRRTIAYVSIFGYFFILGTLALFGRLLFGLDVDNMLKVLTTTAGVLGGVVGAIVGFYFQSENNNS